MSYRVKIPKQFENLKDDNARLNDHTKRVVDELADAIAIWTHNGLDARAIYAALALFHDYYYTVGVARLGAQYMSALEEQAHKLSVELQARGKS